MASETRIVPGGGGGEEARRAVFTVSPVTAYAAPAAPPRSPATTGPVWIPTWSVTGWPRRAAHSWLSVALRFEHVQRGVAGAGRIVLVGDGRAEDRQHGIAHELLDEAVVAL